MARGFSQRTNYVYSAILLGLARTIFIQGNLRPNTIVLRFLECLFLSLLPKTFAGQDILLFIPMHNIKELNLYKIEEK